MQYLQFQSLFSLGKYLCVELNILLGNTTILFHSCLFLKIYFEKTIYLLFIVIYVLTCFFLYLLNLLRHPSYF